MTSFHDLYNSLLGALWVTSLALVTQNASKQPELISWQTKALEIMHSSSAHHFVFFSPRVFFTVSHRSIHNAAGYNVCRACRYDTIFAVKALMVGLLTLFPRTSSWSRFMSVQLTGGCRVSVQQSDEEKEQEGSKRRKWNIISSY